MEIMKKLIFIVVLIIVITINNFSQDMSFYTNCSKLVKYDNFLFMEVNINDSSALFLLDSGSDKSLIDISQSKKYNFTYIEFGDQKYMSAGGVQQIYLPVDFNVKNINIPFFGINLEKINVVFKTKGFQIIGILGGDFLNLTGALIDYKNNFIYYKNN